VEKRSKWFVLDRAFVSLSGFRISHIRLWPHRPSYSLHYSFGFTLLCKFIYIFSIFCITCCGTVNMLICLIRVLVDSGYFYWTAPRFT